MPKKMASLDLDDLKVGYKKSHTNKYPKDYISLPTNNIICQFITNN